MKRTAISLSALVLVVSAGAALAADLPSYKAPLPPPPPPPPMWTGFYVGLNAGGMWSNSSVTNLTTIPGFINFGGVSPLGLNHAISAAVGANAAIPTNTSGFIGGGQIGYNWQFGGSFLAGIEADIQGVAGSNSNSTVTTIATGAGFPANPTMTTMTASRRLDYIGTVRGRLGWLFTPTLLVYGTGGLAYGGVTSNVSLVGAETPAAGPNNGVWFSNGAFSDTRVGWTAGGGVEWMFMPNWSAKVEYLYYDLGRVTYAMAPIVQTFPAAPYWTHFPGASTRFNGNIVRAGLNYHFNWGVAPVIAKY
ncbi:outer membrane protein [Methylocystis sp. ATCC 49242]|uniref:outer membrane protein n=1 Tax=Methylocystis sp. ATCC 49242 TaxID=622637 RepID=UPI0001F888B1|nr:outer membrane beta-barrel protein [Methylocystis sp. ATCC 49242]